MLGNGHLTLKSVHLRPAESWANTGEGLNFLFPQYGIGQYASATGSQRLGVGDVLIASGALGGTFSVAKGAEVVFWCFSLSFEHLFPLFASNEISLLDRVNERYKGIKVYSASSPLSKQCHKLLAEAPPQFTLDHRAQLLRVAGVLFTAEFNDVQAQRVGVNQAEEHMIHVFEKLSIDELMTLSVDELAQKFSCSRRHLNRLFHQHFGFSVATLRMEMRLLRAASLLRAPNVKVINVAEQCGFNHLGLFNTSFKRRFRTTPGEWRKLKAGIRPAEPAWESSMPCPLRTNGLCPWTGDKDPCQTPEAGAGAASRTGAGERGGRPARPDSENGSNRHRAGGGKMAAMLSPG